MKKAFGFTLIEAMIVVLIVAIITGIAVPAYLKSVRKGNRSVAKTELSSLAQRLQRCYTVYGKFNDSSCAAYNSVNASTGVVTGKPGKNDFYTITFSSVSATAYTLSAAATKNPQLQDDGCTTMTLDYSGNAAPDACW